MNDIRKKLIKNAKHILGIPQNRGLSIEDYSKHLRHKYGPKIYHKKFSTLDIIQVMKNMGMGEGSNVFIHSSWDEFYNYCGTEDDFIIAVLNVIGEKGTLIMPTKPLLLKNQIFDVRTSITSEGLLSEAFRRYPGVRRSANVLHSVCAIGPMSGYLIGEHTNGRNCYDELSPYYKLSKINALVFSIGLSKYSIGTIVHCVEGVLSGTMAVYKNMFKNRPSIFRYVDYDGNTNEYENFDIDPNKRLMKYFGPKHFILRYFRGYHHYKKLSNLKIVSCSAEYIIPKMIELGTKGITIYKHIKLYR